MSIKTSSPIFVLDSRHMPFLKGEQQRPNFRYLGWLLLSGLLFLLAALQVNSAIWQWEDWYAIETDGVTAEAQVIISQPSASTDDWLVQYRYTLENDSTVNSSRTVAASIAEGIQAGEIIEIVILPTQPMQSIIAGQNTPPWGYTLRGMGYLLAALAVGAFGILQRRKQQQLQREGEVLTGEITALRRLQGENATTFDIEYVFQSPQNGETLSGTGNYVQRDPLITPKIGMPLAVLYLNDQTYRAL